MSAGYGIGPTCSATGGATSRSDFERRLALLRIGPAQQATKAMNGSPCRSSGMNGSGGAIWNAGNPPSCSGASLMKSRNQRSTSAASDSSKNIGPP